MTERERIFLRHHGHRVCPRVMQAHLTDCNEWLRAAKRLAAEAAPGLISARGNITDQPKFTRWLAQAFPPKEVV